MRKCDIYGTLILGSSISDSFTFLFASNIIVHGGGILQDQTNGHVFLLPERSLLTIYPNGLFVGLETKITTYSTSPTPIQGTNSIVLGSRVNGPFTCGILPGGTIQTYNEVTYIVLQSGDFQVDSCWLGGIAPMADICNLVGGCGISVSTGCQLSTASLNGELDIDINEIFIAVNAMLRLGTPGSRAGFKFKFPAKIDCHGMLVDDTGSTGGILFPMGSALNFFLGGSFSSTVATFLRFYDLTSGAILPGPISLSPSFHGPFYIVILVTGSISISITSNER
jgi:hypothetical protein